MRNCLDCGPVRHWIAAVAPSNLAAGMVEDLFLEILGADEQHTIDARNLPAACAAVLLLGEGEFGLCSESGRVVMPIFGHRTPRRWFRKSFGAAPASYINRNRLPIATALESVRVGGISFWWRMEACSDPTGPENITEERAAKESSRGLVNRSRALAASLRRLEEFDRFLRGSGT